MKKSKHKHGLLWLVPIFVLAAVLIVRNTTPRHRPPKTADISYDPGFWHTDKANIVDENGTVVQIRSMGLLGTWWYEGHDDTSSPSWDHDADTYAELKALGFNAVRLLMGYEFFESSPYCYDSADWDWLDSNIAWAEENGMKIILNMHLTQGGMQHNKSGRALWTDEENQKRLIEMWRMIAERYKDCTTILGWGLINEPGLVLENGTRATNKNFSKLMQSITDAIRQSDKNHIIFCECAIGIYTPRWLKPLNRLLYHSAFLIPYVSDYNLVHEYHFYFPKVFTGDEEFKVGYPGKFLGVQLDDEALKKELLRIRRQFARVYGTDDIPFFLGEFGVSFEKHGRSNPEVYDWVGDCIDLFNEFGYGYSYHMYHGTSCGMWNIPTYRDYHEGLRDEWLAAIFASRQLP